MRGFSLLEVLIATSIVSVGVAAVAPLTAIAVHANLRARQTSVAGILAQQKIEQLLPDLAGGGQPPSPAGTLDADVGGYCDIVGAYRRRWSIASSVGSPGGTWMLRVVVTDLRGRRLAQIVAAKAARVF